MVDVLCDLDFSLVECLREMKSICGERKIVGRNSMIYFDYCSSDSLQRVKLNECLQRSWRTLCVLEAIVHNVKC